MNLLHSKTSIKVILLRVQHFSLVWLKEFLISKLTQICWTHHAQTFFLPTSDHDYTHPHPLPHRDTTMMTGRALLALVGMCLLQLTTVAANGYEEYSEMEDVGSARFAMNLQSFFHRDFFFKFLAFVQDIP